MVVDVPRLPVIHGGPETMTKDRSDEEEEEQEDDDQRWKKPRRHAAFDQKVQDPYASDDPGSMLLPVVVAVGAFIPLLFCLCRL